MSEVTEINQELATKNKARKDNAKGVIVIGLVGIFMFFYVFGMKYNVNILAVSVISLMLCSLLTLNGILNFKLFDQSRIRNLIKKAILISIFPTILCFFLVYYFF